MTDPTNRRQLMEAAIAAGALGAAALAAGGAGAQPAGRKAASYSVKPLAFDPQKIKGLSERLLVSHYENNYGGAVKRLNAISEQLAALDPAKASVFQVNGLKREELIAYNSMALHELYFAGLGEESRPGAALAAALERDFGSLDGWRAEFAAMGRALGGGSGWVLLTWSPRDKRLINAWAADHTHTLAGGTPLLALDMYEHAYHMDYGAKAGDHVTAFLQAIRWSNADALFAAVSKA